MSNATTRWRWAAAGVVGAAHEASGAPCQDRHAVHAVHGPSGEEVLVVVVSDGAGSVANAEAGAEAVVAHLTDGARALVEARGMAAVNREAIEAWIEEARINLDLGLGSRTSFAATLCLAVVGEGRAVYAQIGDGAVAARNREGWTLAVRPHHGPEAAVTTFFTDYDWRANLEYAEFPAPGAVAVMSDGIETLLVRMADMSVHSPAADGLTRPVAASDARGEDLALSAGLAAWMRTPAVLARTHDDKTLVVAVRGDRP